MKKHFSSLTAHLMFATLTAVGALCITGSATAQVAGGTTTVDTSVTESTKLAMGWSVKKTLMGKTIYNDAGEKVGKVEDLIISPDKNVSYVIVGAGGFIGIGRHDVAIPVTQIQDKAGKLVMAGAMPSSWRPTRTSPKARMRSPLSKRKPAWSPPTPRPRSSWTSRRFGWT